MKAKFRTQNGSRFELEVLDISPIGCMVECRSWCPKEMDQVSIRLDGLAAQSATTVWAEDGYAGFQFEQFLNNEVLEALKRKLDDPTLVDG